MSNWNLWIREQGGIAKNGKATDPTETGRIYGDTQYPPKCLCTRWPCCRNKENADYSDYRLGQRNLQAVSKNMATLHDAASKTVGFSAPAMGGEMISVTRGDFTKIIFSCLKY